MGLDENSKSFSTFVESALISFEYAEIGTLAAQKPCSINFSKDQMEFLFKTRYST